MNTVQFNGQAVTPSKVVCIGRNYVAHIRELQNEVPAEPVFFIKPNSAISNELHAFLGEALHYEGELCFLLRDGQLRGVGFGLDLTKRALQSNLKNKGLPWERAKAFDNAAVMSEFVNFDEGGDGLRLELTINGELRQQGGVEMMLYKPQDIVAAAKEFISFEDNDLLMTGTPEGVGVIHKGDWFCGKIFQAERLLLEASWVAQ